ncbi:hypothetical protein [Spongiactinospora sp. TRM90649]|uniref:hypothetical protein n=1 Tax=Spongiactinospora sp. TRM90649 TaxID=3031114 RepID=UPI0023F6C781|nr:hypothetical protein [Spongiactinospora sp. TRM90649]MDF5756604.1 hypothetical protein [Spongiactinospora sp. TRM90649]
MTNLIVALAIVMVVADLAALTLFAAWTWCARSATRGECRRAARRQQAQRQLDRRAAPDPRWDRWLREAGLSDPDRKEFR